MAASGEFVVTVRPVTDPLLHMNVEACAAKWRQEYLGTLERCITETPWRRLAATATKTEALPR
jgi:hypothetical protein